MPSPYKITALFSQGIQGWSESLYVQEDNANAAFNRCLAYARIRSQMLNNAAACDYLRVSHPGGFRSSSTTAVGIGTQYDMPRSTWESENDLVNASLLSTIYSSPNDVQRPYWLSGLPDDVFNVKNPNNADAQRWSVLYLGLLKPLLTGGNYYIKCRRFGSTVITLYQPTSWNNVSGTLTSTMAFSSPLPPVVPGDMIGIRGVRDMKAVSSLVKVLKMDSSSGILTIAHSLPEDYVFTPGVSIYKNTPLYAPIDFLNRVRFGTRKRGRPFGVVRGRAPARA